MSTFFKALEQAERERTLREQGRLPGEPAAEVSPPVEQAAAVEAPPARRVARAAPRPDPEPSPARYAERWPGATAPRRPAPDGIVGDIDEHLVSLLQPMSPAAEQYRALRHVVEQLHHSDGLSVFAVSSPALGDGKTTTAINLAGALAQSPDARVLLVEADLRQPAVGNRLGLSGTPVRGLVDAIETPGLGLDDIVQRRPPFENLGVLLAGRVAPAPYEALESPRLRDLIEQARNRYDYVVVDTPPILSVPDCRVIGKWVDAFMVVVAAHRTPRKMLEEALNVMEPSKVIGLVFAQDDRSASSYYAYGTYGTRPARSSMAPFAIGARQ
jgi:capsular exopolysaccharide synthesis family protein